MNPYFFLSLSFICFWATNHSVLAQKHSSTSPSIAIPESIARDIYGPGKHKAELTCYALINNMVQNQGQAVPICNEAVLTCIRHGLIQQMVHILSQSHDHKASFKLENLKEALVFSTHDAQYKLAGCAVGIAMSGASAVSTSLSEITGY